MMGWIFKKADAPTPDTTSPSSPGDAMTTSAAPASGPTSGDWAARLQAARGDDAALLALTLERAPLELRLAAAGALESETALKQAERELRNHDRRLHRLAKQRYGALVARRLATEEASRLTAAAQALLDEPQIAVNRLVELDRAWQSLQPDLLDAAQRGGFESLLAQLSALTRERADAALKLERWTAQAQRALVEMRAACSEAAAGTRQPGGLAGVRAAALQIIESAPAGDASGTLRDALRGACEGCERLEERLAVFEELLRASTTPHSAEQPAARAKERPAEQPPEGEPEATVETTKQQPTEQLIEQATEVPPTERLTELPIDQPTEQTAEQPTEQAAEQPTEQTAEQPTEQTAEQPTHPSEAPADARPGVGVPEPAAAPPDPVQRWQQLPPLADALLNELLDRRFEQWQQSQQEAEQARLAQKREQAKARQRATRHERTGNLIEVLAQAEAALAEGHLAATHKHLVRIDELLHGGASAGELRSRIDVLQAGYAQLKGWQHWAGGRARDELVLQAEALAAATVGAADAPAVKLSIRQRAELIDDLRARWKELDRLGGATSRSLWQRFDAALEVAYQPVAAQVAAQRAARQQNLLARQQLLATLEAFALPEVGDGAAASGWRPAAGALDHFRSAWHKLGPLEHTVPHKARKALVERMVTAVARLETPLHEARREARLGREQLIAQAHGLAADAGTGALGRDLVDRVRAVQADWQQQARAMPLARAEENALWLEFKAAIDTCFGARKAFFDARDAESRAHDAERLGLIHRLEALSAETAPADIRRTLAEVETQWQRARPASRNEAAALEARFVRARELAHGWLGRAAQNLWHASCDALIAKLALCEASEDGADASAAAAEPTVAQRWAALAELPAPWEQALGERAGLIDKAAAGPPPRTESTDDLLLQSEAAWGLASPPAFEAARRQLKLQAMKAALEGRRPTAAGGRVPAPLTPELALVALLRRSGLDALQRERLGALLQAVRQRGPVDEAGRPRPTPVR